MLWITVSLEIFYCFYDEISWVFLFYQSLLTFFSLCSFNVSFLHCFSFVYSLFISLILSKSLFFVFNLFERPQGRETENFLFWFIPQMSTKSRLDWAEAGSQESNTNLCACAVICSLRQKLDQKWNNGIRIGILITECKCPKYRHNAHLS